MDRHYNNNNGHRPNRRTDDYVARDAGEYGGRGGPYPRRSRSRDRDRRRSRTRSRSRERSGRVYGPEDDYDTRDSRSNYSSSSSNYRAERHRGRDDYRGGHDRRDYHHRKKGHHSRGSGNYSPNSGYNHGRENHDEHDDDYDSYESDDGGRYASQTPNSKIVVRGLAPNVTEADIVSDLMQFNLKPLNIRLIRRKNTGASRGFAFVEFSTEEEATRWMNYKQGVLIIQDQYRAILQYSSSRGGPGSSRPGVYPSGGANSDNITDWYCSKCLVFNFKRRENCFKCYASREESERGGDGWDEVSNVLTKKIILRNLDVLTNEEGVLTVMQEVLPLEQVAKISKILVCRDPLTNTSRGICYLAFETLVDSMNVFNCLKALDPLVIDERNVNVSYCVDESSAQPESEGQEMANYDNGRKYNDQNYYNQQTPMGPSLPEDSSSNLHSTQGVNTYQYTLADVPRLAEYGAKLYATNAAEHEHYYRYYTQYYISEIEAGNFANLPTISQLGGETANSGAAVAQSAMQRKQQQQGRKRPNPYDTPKGYGGGAANASHPAAGQQMFWDGEQWTYAAVQGTSATTTVEPEKKEVPAAEVESGKAPDKVKHAKKIVKDMEKWAKQLNQKKDSGGALQLPVPVKEEHPLRPGGALSSTGGGADVGFAILEKKESPKVQLTPQLASKLTTPASATNTSKIVAYGSDSDNDPGDHHERVINEKDYVDFKNLTCLLCKRAFQSEEIIRKHLKMSALHQENLAKYKAERASNTGDSSGVIGSDNYRDRAKERRLKYGEADPTPLNKSRERFHKEIEKQTSAAALVAASAAVAQNPIGGGNVGNKLLQKMGWKDGQGLGRTNQGRTNIIEVESRAGQAGLGTKTAGPFVGGDYKSYIRMRMKQRYEQAE